ncbi:MAG: hypothetical protein QME79_04855 [Bacillota bacterium]|nr:hypothetical protein [Bacillota bacterium]
MADPDWVHLFSQGLALVDRVHRLLTPPAAEAGGEKKEGRAALPARRPMSPQEAIQAAHRLLDALEGKPQRRRGLFW